MGNLLELLQRVDAAVMAAFTAAGTSDEDQPVWSALLAVLGGALVLAGALLLAGHARVELGVVAAGLLLTVPFLQARFDRARAAVEE